MPVIRLDRLEQFAAVNLLLDPGAVGGPVIVPSCAQVKLLFSLESGKTAHIVLYGRYTGAFAGTALQATNIHTALSTGGAWSAVAAFLATSTGFLGVTIKNVSIQDQVDIGSTSPSAAGTSASPALPNEVAACITLHTSTAGQSGRGRSYVPGFATNALGVGNVIAAGAVSALNTWAGTWGSALSAQGYVWVLGLKERQSYVGSTGTLHPARAATSIPITTATLRDNHWDSQRRRGLR